MSRQKAGLKKEHDVASEIAEATGHTVIPLRAGWSGNSRVPAPDLLIPYKGSLRALEMKTSGQKRMRISPEDCDDIIHWALDMTEMPCYPYLSVKFTHYEMYTGRLYPPWNIEEAFENWAEDAPFDAHVTNGGNLSIGHPTHYDCECQSAVKSPGDGVAVLRDLYLDEDAAHVSARETVDVHAVLNSNPDYWNR